jgi:hypothetical protein
MALRLGSPPQTLRFRYVLLLLLPLLLLSCLSQPVVRRLPPLGSVLTWKRGGRRAGGEEENGEEDQRQVEGENEEGEEEKW